MTVPGHPTNGSWKARRSAAAWGRTPVWATALSTWTRASWTARGGRRWWGEHPCRTALSIRLALLTICVYYDVVTDLEPVVKIRAICVKTGNQVFIAGKEGTC